MTLTIEKTTLTQDQLIRHIKIVLHTYIYNDLNIAQLIDNILEIDPFSIVYNSNDRSINIKMKKTSIKKYQDYSNDLSFFYNFFSSYIYNNLLSLIPNIINCMNLQNINITQEQIMQVFSNNLYNFYTLTLLNDNFIIIHL